MNGSFHSSHAKWEKKRSASLLVRAFIFDILYGDSRP
jgi:hypothetical protein